MVRPLKLDGLTEQIQDYIAANFVSTVRQAGASFPTGGYVVGTNFLAENAMQYQDIARLLGNEVLLTLFDEGGTLNPSGRQTHQTRLFRFVTKGSHSNEALDRARDLIEWLWNAARHFTTTDFRVRVQTPQQFPAVIDRGDSGSFLADAIVPFFVTNRHG